MAKKVGKRTLKATPTSQIDGKLQPQALELEKAVLGALMIDNESLSDAIDSLQAEYFYAPKHQKIFEAIVNLFNNTQAIKILVSCLFLPQKEHITFSLSDIIFFFPELHQSYRMLLLLQQSSSNLYLHPSKLYQNLVLNDLQ